MIKDTASFAFKSVVFSLLFVGFFLIVLGIYLYTQDGLLRGKIYPHVYINGVDFGGKKEADVVDFFAKKNAEAQTRQIILKYKDSEIATFSGEMISARFDGTTALIQAKSIGRSPRPTTRIAEQFMSLMNIRHFEFNARFSYDTKPVQDYLDGLADKYNTEPEDALFRFENNRVTNFKIEKKGLRVNTNEARTQFEKVLTHSLDHASSTAITITDTMINPEVTLSDSNDFGIVEKIAEGVSNYTGSIPGRVHNVLLASSKMDGILIPKGDTFSFNKIIGDISSNTGYQQAYIIKNGQTVLGDGGGVCQVSTTLFRAALNAGLPIDERHAHAYRVHYYENDSKPGFDATVFNPSADFKFTNDTSASILIQREVNTKTNILKFVLYGKKDDRKVEISDVKLTDFKPAPEPMYQDDPTLKRGTTKQVDWAASGIRSKFHYRVTNNDAITFDKDFISVYKPWKAIYLVGTGD